MLNADIPASRVVAGVRVGLLPDLGFVVNPTIEQMEASTLDLVIAGAQLMHQPCGCLRRPSLLSVDCLGTWARDTSSQPWTLQPAGTTSAVLMIEGYCDFLTEDQMLEVRIPTRMLFLLNSPSCAVHRDNSSSQLLGWDSGAPATQYGCCCRPFG